MSKAAFIGLGAMGSRVAANLLKAGHEVTVCDLVPEAVKKLADSGAKTAASAREAAEGNEFVLTMVRDDEVSRKVWLDATNGALGMLKRQGVDPNQVLDAVAATALWNPHLTSDKESTRTVKTTKHPSNP